MFLKRAGGMNIYIRDMLVLTRLRGLQNLFLNFDILLHHKKSTVGTYYSIQAYQQIN